MYVGMADRLKPLYSAQAENPALSESIDRFVLGLAERVDHLQDAQFGGDRTRVAELSRSLASDADAVGYAPLAQLAEEAAGAAEADDLDEARAVLRDLTEVAQRVRCGYPGAI